MCVLWVGGGGVGAEVMPYHGSGDLHLSHLCFVSGFYSFRKSDSLHYLPLILCGFQINYVQMCVSKKGKTCYGSYFGGQVSEMSPTISLNIGVIFAALL